MGVGCFVGDFIDDWMVVVLKRRVEVWKFEMLSEMLLEYED